MTDLQENKNAKEFVLEKHNTTLKVMIFILPFCVLFTSIYMALWHKNAFNYLIIIIFDEVFYTIAIVITGIILHELIHALTWALSVKSRFRAIRFGLLKTSFTPYCHCNETMKLSHYVIGSIMPGVLLGVLPLILSIVSGNFKLFFFGIIFLIGAGSDFLMVWKLRNENRNNHVLDHPDEIGCIVYTGDNGL